MSGANLELIIYLEIFFPGSNVLYDHFIGHITQLATKNPLLQICPPQYFFLMCGNSISTFREVFPLNIASAYWPRYSVVPIRTDKHDPRICTPLAKQISQTNSLICAATSSLNIGLWYLVI